MSPSWFLFLFAPLPVEYVSGSSPYLNPFVYLANFLLYGAGTILIRELKIRWHKGWLAVFIMSIAYVVAEEGLMLNTLFDPTKNTSGRAWGVNWVWTVGMFVVHSLMSVFMPILLAEGIYHEKANESWVKPRTAFILLALFWANVFVIGRIIAPVNRPSVPYYLAEFAIIGGCLWLANLAPAPCAERNEAKPIRTAQWLYVASLIGMVVTMIVGFATPTLAVPAIAKAGIMFGFYGAFLAFLNHNRVFDVDFAPLSKFAVAAGLISFWLVVAVIMTFGKRNPGPLAFGILVTVVLIRALKKLNRENSSVKAEI